MLTTPKIDNFYVGFEWTDAAYVGMAQKIPVELKAKLTNLRNVFTQRGTYSPAEDYLYLLQNVPSDKRPNFFILVCSGQVNLTMTAPNIFALNAMPIFKVFELLMPADTTYQINGVFIEGRTSNVPSPMPQGIPIDYFMIAGQADIS